MLFVVANISFMTVYIEHRKKGRNRRRRKVKNNSLILKKETLFGGQFIFQNQRMEYYCEGEAISLSWKYIKETLNFIEYII